MDAGFVLESVDGGGTTTTKWVRGEPEKSFWLGLKVSDKERVPIRAYRCPSCWLLRLFAAPA